MLSDRVLQFPHRYTLLQVAKRISNICSLLELIMLEQEQPLLCVFCAVMVWFGSSDLSFSFHYHVVCVLTLFFLLSFLCPCVTSLPNSISQNDLSSTVPKSLHFDITSQRVSELLDWPVSKAELEQTLFPSVPVLQAQTARRELKIIEFMKKRDFRATVLSRTKR